MNDDERKAKNLAAYKVWYAKGGKEYQARRRKMIADGTWATRHVPASAAPQSSPSEPVAQPEHEQRAPQSV